MTDPRSRRRSAEEEELERGILPGDDPTPDWGYDTPDRSPNPFPEPAAPPSPSEEPACGDHDE